MKRSFACSTDIKKMNESFPEQGNPSSNTWDS